MNNGRNQALFGKPSAKPKAKQVRSVLDQEDEGTNWRRTSVDVDDEIYSEIISIKDAANKGRSTSKVKLKNIIKEAMELWLEQVGRKA